MNKNVIRTTVTAIAFFGFTAAAFAVTGEFSDMCTTGLSMKKQIKTDCSVNATYNKKTYCFGDQKAEVMFFKDPDNTLSKAEAYYSEIKK